MNDAIFSNLWGEALTAADQDAYVSDWSISSIWGDDPTDDVPQDRIAYLSRLWDAAHMSIRQIVDASGLKQSAFATRYCIPYRTVQDWYGGRRQAPDYVRLMLIRLLGLL